MSRTGHNDPGEKKGFGPFGYIDGTRWGSVAPCTRGGSRDRRLIPLADRTGIGVFLPYGVIPSEVNAFNCFYSILRLLFIKSIQATIDLLGSIGSFASVLPLYIFSSVLNH